MKKIKHIILFSLAAVFSLQALLHMPMEVQAEPLTVIEERIEEISQEEKKILEALFIRQQEIEEAQRLEDAVQKDIVLLAEEIEAQRIKLTAEELEYDNKRLILQEVLRGYQRRGVASYLHVIISSRSLSDLFKRLNIIREFTRGSGELLEELKESRENLRREAELLETRRERLEALEAELKERIASNQQMKDELETKLAALGTEGQYYRENLQLLQHQWRELALHLSSLREIITHIIKEGSLSPDVLKITYGLFNARVAIEEKDFNNIFKGDPALSMLEFKFIEDAVIMSVPERGLELTGKFMIRSGNHLELVVEEGSFYHMPLKQESIADLFKEGPLVIDLSPITEGNSIRSITIFDGYLELLIIPILF